jgi:uncharacterized peroxidase-related enzyme
MPHIQLPDGLPGITGLFSFRPDTAKPLRALAEVLLRGPSTLTSGEREMIATFVSSRNDCYFCQTSHAAAAAHHLGGDYRLVDAVRADYQSAPVSPKLKALLAIAAKVRQGGKNVTTDEVEQARKEGATDLEIHDTVLIAAAFCMYNRYVDGLATIAPKDEKLYDQMGARMAKALAWLKKDTCGHRNLPRLGGRDMSSAPALSEGVLRIPATISPGMRELIAAWTSCLNGYLRKEAR